MSEIDFVKYMIQKYSLAVAIAVIKSKPDKLTLLEYIELLKKNAIESQKSADSFFDDISVHNSDFDEDNTNIENLMMNKSNDSETILKDIDKNIIGVDDPVNIINAFKHIEDNVKKKKPVIKTSTPSNLTQSTFYESLPLSITPSLKTPNEGTFCTSFSQENSKTNLENQFNIESAKLKTPITNMYDSQETDIYTVHGFTQNFTHISQSQDNLVIAKNLLDRSLSNVPKSKNKLTERLNENSINSSNNKQPSDLNEPSVKKHKINSASNNEKSKEISNVNKIVRQVNSNEETYTENIIPNLNNYDKTNRRKVPSKQSYYHRINEITYLNQNRSVNTNLQKDDLRDISDKVYQDKEIDKQKETTFVNYPNKINPSIKKQVYEQNKNVRKETFETPLKTLTSQALNNDQIMQNNTAISLGTELSHNRKETKDFDKTNTSSEIHKDRPTAQDKIKITQTNEIGMEIFSNQLSNNHQNLAHNLNGYKWTNSVTDEESHNGEINLVAQDQEIAPSISLEIDKNLQPKSKNISAEMESLASETENTWTSNSYHLNSTKFSKKNNGSLNFTFLNNVTISDVQSKSIKENESLSFGFINNTNNSTKNDLRIKYSEFSPNDTESNSNTETRENNLRQRRIPNRVRNFELDIFSDRNADTNINTVNNNNKGNIKFKLTEENTGFNNKNNTFDTSNTNVDFNNFNMSDCKDTVTDFVNNNHTIHNKSNSKEQNACDIFEQSEVIDILTQTKDLNSHIHNSGNYTEVDHMSEESIDAEEAISFKVLEEFNKVKKYLYKKESNGDLSMNSSQSRKSLCATQYSKNWINEAGHCLLDFLAHCPLVSRTKEITGDVSKIFGLFIDKLHEEESCPTFLEKNLNTVQLFLGDIYEGYEPEDVTQKYEYIERLLFLTRSINILKYTVENITFILEEFHTKLKGEIMLEIDFLGKCENICYIFHILEILLKRYTKNLKQTQTGTQPSQEKSLKRSDITEIWRKKWNLTKNEVSEGTFKKKCILTDCSQILNKIIVSAMDGYSLISFSALQCFNLLQK